MVQESVSVGQILPMPVPENCRYLTMPINRHIPKTHFDKVGKQKRFLTIFYYHVNHYCKASGEQLQSIAGYFYNKVALQSRKLIWH